MKLARRLHAIKPSPTLALNARAKSLAAKGVDILSFAAGEPDFDTPDFIREATVDALNRGFTKYTATSGIPELRTAICDKLRRDNGLDYAPEQVLVSCGAKHSLYNIFQAIVDPGDQVLIFSPFWVSYPDMVRLADGEPVVLTTREEEGWAPRPEQLEAALNPKVRAVVLNSPGNPTGAVYNKQTLTRLAEVLRKHDCLIITDDIYEKLLYTSEPFVNILNAAPDLKERTVVVNGMSKAFSMTGWRLGYAAGPRDLIAAMQSIQDQSTSNATSFVQKGGVAALTGPAEAVERMRREFKQRCDLFVSGLNAIKGFRCRAPEGSFYVFPNIQDLIGKQYKGQPITGSVHASEVLLEDFRIAAVPGLPFGAEGYLRMSFATSREVIEKGLARLRQFSEQLK